MTPANRSIDPPTDPLSSVGRKLLRLDAETAYTKLLPGASGNAAAQAILESISSRDLVDGPIASPDDADALVSALWLRHDWLDESHKISQRIESATGSLWHAIMHRREGDFSNSKYWYRRADGHPIVNTLAIRAGDVINPFPADKSVFKMTAHGWNPSAFVDLVEAVHRSPSDPRHRVAVSIQELEWQVLFEHCTRAQSDDEWRIAMDVCISNVIVVLDKRWENKLDEAVAILKQTGLQVTNADDDNSVVEGTVDACKVADLQKLDCVDYVRVVFSYDADFPPGDPRDRNGV